MIERRVLPAARWPTPDLAAVWRSRDLLLMLAWRDLAAGYRQTVVGYGWILFKTLATVAVYSVVFGALAKLPAGEVPYPLFALAGIVPWTLFSASVTQMSQSIVAAAPLLSKVAFPRLVLPLASTAPALADLAAQLALLTIVLGFARGVGRGLLLLPLWIVAVLAVALSVGLWIAAWNARFRDLGQATPFLLQLGMWLTPVLYDSRAVPDRWQWLFALNPLATAIDGFRSAALGTDPPGAARLALAVAIAGPLLAAGLWHFARAEQTFADVV